MLKFERPIFEISSRIKELEHAAQENAEDSLYEEINRLKLKLDKIKVKTYSNLNAWQKTQIARLNQRVGLLDFITNSVEDFLELHGDRQFADDKAIITGFGKLESIPMAFIGHRKGRNTKDNMACNFGMARPEGYRKALRVMKLSEKFKLPIITFIDTPGAYPGIEAEERNQSEAIARNLIEMASMKVPIISIIIGEGGSGGALALAVSNKTLMMEHSIYSVISPEGCASILWKDAEKAPEAAEKLKYTAQDLLEFNIIDGIISEPVGGSHNNSEETFKNISNAIIKHYNSIKVLNPSELIENRYLKFRNIKGTKI